MAERRASRASVRRAPGRHLLVRRVVDDLVEDSGVGPGDLVLDLGAGTGRITDALRRRGADVIALELDETFGRALIARFAGQDGVTVTIADARAVALPERPFRVVANLPFTGSGAILDRLLDPRGSLVRADVVLEWDAARKRAEVWPSTCRGVIASAFFALAIDRRLPPACFEPPPAVAAAVLTVARRARPRIAPAEADRYAGFVRDGFAHPDLAVALKDHVSARRLRRLADSFCFRRNAAGRDLDGRQWASLYVAVTRRAPAGPHDRASP